MSYHLGISAYYHDSAAALVADGYIIAAAQEERFTRKRHDPSFPAEAVKHCLDSAGISLDDLATVSYYEDPPKKFTRTLSSFASAGPSAIGTFGRIIPGWLREKRGATKTIDTELMNLGRGNAPQTRTGLHHRSHAASAFYPSPFDDAAVLCVDGVGEWHTTSIWHGQDTSLDLVNSISYPHSLGLLYSAFTYYCGFKVDSGEYKLMGLAPYGEPKYANIIRDNLIALRDDGSFSLNLEKFAFLQGERMTGDAFAELFGRPARQSESELTQMECDLAASVQVVTDEAVLGLARAAKKMTGSKNLCLAGGVALNCVSNGHIARSGVFSNIWIQPAAGDAGCALGAALLAMVEQDGQRSIIPKGQHDAMFGSYLGSSFEDWEIGNFLDSEGIRYERLTEDKLVEKVAEKLSESSIVGWFQGPMEFGPRSLGGRSILGDPRSQDMQKTMNLKIKFRESFRPFAPSVLEEDAHEYFDLTETSPYMLVVAPVTKDIRVADAPSRALGAINESRSTLPAITHVDFSARVQTVSDENNPRYYALLKAFKAKTGCPVLVNTSFNVRGEPIVRSPRDAYLCFMRTGLDVLVLGDFLVLKENQPELHEDTDWRTEIPLD
ncbi:MAG: hypothetical protein GQ535_16015 [Rhodobacteraceae bacterium]|nr:hypothetical protein [Paracoccaceae bacterium]